MRYLKPNVAGECLRVQDNFNDANTRGQSSDKWYNPPKRWFRGMKQIMMTTWFIAIGTMMIPIGFVLWGIYYVTPNASQWLKIIADAGWVFGIVAIVGAVRRARQDDKDANRKHQDLIAEIRGLREDFKKK